MEFRKDINGLRAIAIFGVIAFHFSKSSLAGGFAGVDVFFVISGYLMTRIIFGGMEKGNFSLIKFYSARCKRIIPALLVLVFSLLIYGWFALGTSEYQTLAKHSIDSLFFLSNISYWLESSYFATDSATKWLLHTWSLSVEWQFYIIYPLVLLLIRRLISHNNAKKMIFLLTIISFSVAVYSSINWPTAAFFLLPSRAWEMMLGGLAYLYPWTLKDSNKKIASLAGIFMIVTSYILLDEGYSWPGYFALLPTIGAYLIILSQWGQNPLICNRAFQVVGDSSYSIYLWHWPVVVYLYNNSLLENVHAVLLGVLLSFVLGFISYGFIERPVKKIAFKYLACSFSLVALALFLVNKTDGVDYTFREMAKDQKSIYANKYIPENYFNDIMRNNFKEQCNFYDSKTFKAKEVISKECLAVSKKGGIFIWGDSHAQALGQGLRDVFTKVNVRQIASSSCKPGLVPDQDTKGEVKKACDKSNETALELIKKINPDVVVLVQRAHHQNNNFDAIATTLKSYGVRKVIVIGPVPQYDIALPTIISQRHWPSTEKTFEDVSINRTIFDTDKAMISKSKSSNAYVYISLIKDLCSGYACLAKIDNQNTPLVWDYGHLTLQGAIFITRNYLEPKIAPYL